jgi:asparagine synthase (glutamine-hydrolysing)
MCGFAGIIYSDRFRPVLEKQISDMIAPIIHRGPDDSGIVVRGNLGFGFRRLSIIDISPSGHQPMSNEAETIWLMMNGEIYNFRE